MCPFCSCMVPTGTPHGEIFLRLKESIYSADISRPQSGWNHFSASNRSFGKTSDKDGKIIASAIASYWEGFTNHGEG